MRGLPGNSVSSATRRIILGFLLIFLGVILSVIILLTDGWTDYLLAIQIPVQVAAFVLICRSSRKA